MATFTMRNFPTGDDFTDKVIDTANEGIGSRPAVVTVTQAAIVALITISVFAVALFIGAWLVAGP
jgi:hypothetical protein